MILTLWLLMGLLIGATLWVNGTSRARRPALAPPLGSAPPPVATATATPALAEVVLSISGLHTATGVGLDSAGTIYIAEAPTPVVRTFDPRGQATGGWRVPISGPDLTLVGDRAGTVYVAEGPGIWKYAAPAGRLLAQWHQVGSGNVTGLAPRNDGGLEVALGTNDVIHFDSQGRPVRTITAATIMQHTRFALDLRVAVDGHGRVYVLNTGENLVLIFSDTGTFLGSFGGEATGPGYLAASQAIAADGRGRIYIAYAGGVAVFADSGRYRGTIALPQLDDSPVALISNGDQDLYVLSPSQLLKLQMRPLTDLSTVSPSPRRGRDSDPVP